MRSFVTPRLIGSLLCSFATASSALWASPSIAADSANHPGPVVVIGVDGMTFDVLDPLIAAGRTPHLAAAVRQGARAVLMSETPMRSPALWTTVATGQPRRVHRIFDFVTGSAYWPRRLRGGDKKLVTSDMRRAEALWQWADGAGRSSLVVGWLNTWPAEAVRGVMVAPYVALGQRRQTSIKGRIYDDVARQTHPAALTEAIRNQVVDTEEVSTQRVARLIDEPERGSPIYRQVPQLERYLYTVRWSIASALTNTQIIEQQLEASPHDLVMTYFDGSDTLAHRFWLFRQPVEDIRARLRAHGLDPALAPELKRRLGNAVDGYYELIDEMIGRIMAAAGEDATLIVVSDHGWGSLSKGAHAPHDHVPFDGEHRMEGILIASGPYIRNVQANPFTLYDVAPTALHLMGLAVPAGLPGRVASELIDPAFARAYPPMVLARTQPKPKEKAPAPVEDSHFAEQEMERLRSLGYVQ